MSTYKYDNPFYDNHIFRKEDLQRARLTFSDKIRVFLRPMLVQITSDGTVFYKTDRQGRYYIFGIEARKEAK